MELEKFKKEFFRFFYEIDCITNYEAINNFKTKDQYLLDNTGTLIRTQIPDFSPLVNEHYESYYGELEDTIKDRPFFKTCQQIFLFADPRSVIINNVIKVLEISYINQEKLFPYFKRVDEVDLSMEFEIDPIVNEVMKNFYELILKETIQIQAVFTLYNLVTSNELINSNFRIRKISEDEKSRILNNSVNHFGHNYKNDYDLVLESNYLIDTNNPEEFNERVLKKVNNFITALRLVSKGSVGYDSSYYKTIPMLSYPNEIYYMNKKFKDIHNVTIIKKGDSQLINEINTLLNNDLINKFVSINTALKRFNFGLDRNQIQDKIIDFSVCFEAIFSNNDEIKDSITFKLSTRVARLLSGDFSERKKIYRNMTKFYAKRSKIVHGREKNEENLDLTIIEEYVRESIIIYLHMLKTYFKNKVDPNEDDFHQDFLHKIDFKTTYSFL
jgi:hypothetical protein